MLPLYYVSGIDYVWFKAADVMLESQASVTDYVWFKASRRSIQALQLRIV